MKRTPIRRKSRLRSRNPMRRSRIKPRSTKRSRPAGYEDPDYLAWLEQQPCRVTGKVGGNVAHHLRHTATGAAMGGHVKDDRRAITLDPKVHINELHANAGHFKGWSKSRLREWENDQLAIQRSQYLAVRGKEKT